MKVSSSKPENDFEPFDLTIRFETEEEAKQFYFLFNFPSITDTCVDLDDSSIRESIKNKYRDAWDAYGRLSEAVVARVKTDWGLE